MKADFFSFLTYILVIMLIIPGTISSVASAVDEEPADSINLDSGDSNLNAADSDTANSSLDSTDSDTANSSLDSTDSDTGSNDGSSDSDNGDFDSGSSNGSSDSNNGDFDSGSDNGDSDSDSGDNDSNPDNGDFDSGSDDGNSSSEDGDSDSGKEDSDPGSDDENSGSDDKDSGLDDNNSDSSSGYDSETGDSDTTSDTENLDTSNKGNSSTGESSSVTSDNGNSKTHSSSNVSSSTEISDRRSSSTQDGSSNSSSSNSSSSNSSSSSGSGMNLLSSEPASNVAVKELVTRSVISGYPVRFDFVENVTCVTYIEFDPKKTYRKTTTIVEELRNNSTLVPTLPPGTVYKHVNVWVGDKGAGLPTSIRNGAIEFKVEKSWIKDKSINESLITLQRYDEDWQPLYTEKVREDENYIYFAAETPGYSFFAITEYNGQNGDKEKIRGAYNIHETLRNLGGEGRTALNGNAEKGNSRIKNPMGAARILMAISLPLFMILVGYCLLKKKI